MQSSSNLTSFHLTKEVKSSEDFLNEHYLSAKPISNLNAMIFLGNKMVPFVET